jgi:hypothetical protein
MAMVLLDSKGCQDTELVATIAGQMQSEPKQHQSLFRLRFVFFFLIDQVTDLFIFIF